MRSPLIFRHAAAMLTLAAAAASMPMALHADPGGKQTIVSGIVAAERRSAISVRSPARIVAVYAADSGAVRHGQVLVQLDDSDMRAQLASARAALTAALAQWSKATAGKAAERVKTDSDVTTARNALQDATRKRDQAALSKAAITADSSAEIKAAEQGVDKANLALQHAHKTVTDLETLDKVGGVSKNDLDSARLQEKLCTSDMNGALAGLDRLKQGPNGIPYRVALAQADLDTAEQGVTQARQAVASAAAGGSKAIAVAEKEVSLASAAVAQARTSVASAADQVAAMRLKSPLDGIASSVKARAGEMAEPGVPLLTVVSLKELRVEAMVLSRSIMSIRVGTHASVAVDTLPGRLLDAVVTDIAKVAEADGRTVCVKFKVSRITNLKPGLAVTVYIGARR